MTLKKYLSVVITSDKTFRLFFRLTSRFNWGVLRIMNYTATDSNHPFLDLDFLMFFTQILTKILLDSSWSTHFLISISQFFCPKSWQNLAKLELFFHFHFPFGVHWRSEDCTTQLPKLWHATSMLSGIASPRFSQVKNALCCVHGALKASWLLCNVAISSSSTCFLSAH